MNDVISQLIKGTDFEVMSDESSGLTNNRPILRTPVEALNAFIGGGIPLGCIAEIFGPNAGGKSTFSYQTMGRFLDDYEDGVAILLDSEATTDTPRMKALGIHNPERILRLRVTSLEQGFSSIMGIIQKIIKNDNLKQVPIMILWDTIANAPTQAQLDGGRTNAGGMAEAARVIKAQLKTLTTYVSQYNILVILLNQVISNIGSYAGGFVSAGGNGLSHDIHLKLYVDGGNTNYEEGIYAVSKTSYIQIHKSKISPIMKKGGFPMVLDITKGGIIDSESSLLSWMCTIGILQQGGGWYYLSDETYKNYESYCSKVPILGKKFRYNDLVARCKEDPYISKIFNLMWTDLVGSKYVLQKEVCQSYRDKLVLDLDTHYECNSSESVINDSLAEGLSDILGEATESEETDNEEISE